MLILQLLHVKNSFMCTVCSQSPEYSCLEIRDLIRNYKVGSQVVTELIKAVSRELTGVTTL